MKLEITVEDTQGYEITVLGSSHRGGEISIDCAFFSDGGVYIDDLEDAKEGLENEVWDRLYQKASDQDEADRDEAADHKYRVEKGD